MKNKSLASLLTLLMFCSCGNENADPVQNAESEKDTVVLQKIPRAKVSPKKKFLAKEVMAEELQPIRDNFNRINAIEKWTSTVKKDFGETTEGGEADYCYLHGKLEKIVYRQFGETFQKVTEFYLMDGKLSFVFEKNSKYNRPIYWDSIAMKENGDDQVWDIEKSEITETRNFLEEGKLIHQLNQDRRAPLTSAYLSAEQKRIQHEYDKLQPAPVQEINVEKTQPTKKQ